MVGEVVELGTLLGLLVAPEKVSEVADGNWNRIIREGRQTQTLGQLGSELQRTGAFALLIPAVQRHLRLALITSQARSAAAEWEIQGIRRALPPQIPIMLLKGCAYAAMDDRNSRGRLFSDIDLLVPQDQLQRAEASLLAAGWMGKRVNAYDQRYYREWTHEIPPLEHVRRHTVVDLHHAIIPPVSRYGFAVQKLWDDALEIRPGIFVPSAIDRIIHCAVHLIQEGEASKVFRDLYDLYLLFSQHCADQELTSRLYLRADYLGLGGLVKPAISAAVRVFSGHEKSRGGPKTWLETILVNAALSHNEVLVNTGASHAARWLLLAHSHWMKLPLRLLIPHLFHKARVGIFAKEKVGEAN